MLVVIPSAVQKPLAKKRAGTRAASPEPSLQRKSLTEQLLQILEARIVAGVLPPGTRLSEESLAAEFSISRSPVRDVLAALEREGLADRIGLRDRRVATPTRKYVYDTYETWIVLETHRTYVSAQDATPVDHAEIRAALAAMKAALKEGREREYARIANTFPDLLHNRCDNRQLLAVLHSFEKYRRWLATLYLGDDDPSLMMLEEHREIGEAYIRADRAALAAAIESHVRKQRDRVMANLPDAPER